MSRKFVDRETARDLVGQLGEEFFVIRNPSYVFPKYEPVPLAPKKERVKDLLAVVMDMDGTTTTTEELCLHSLEHMVRLITGRTTAEEWSGLDVKDDYPHIIGNSTTRHVEFLLEKYADWVDPAAFAESFIRAAVWTIRQSRDAGRTAEVVGNLRTLGAEALVDAAVKGDPDAHVARFVPAVSLSSFDARLRAAIDVYYQRYHYILSLIAANDREALASELPFLEPGAHLISPMPGVAEFLALAKDILPEGDAMDAHVLKLYREHPHTRWDDAKAGRYRENLKELRAKFSERPLKVGVVTSSIHYEAEVVLGEVFKVIREQIVAWPCPDKERDLALNVFSDVAAYYDGFVTATDSSEMRLKPHRDLYSLALYRLGLGPEDFDKVAGFEDSESGTVAIRAAGVNLCVAVPFYGTEFHDLAAASHTLPGGLLEAMLEQGMFLG